MRILAFALLMAATGSAASAQPAPRPAPASSGSVLTARLNQTVSPRRGRMPIRPLEVIEDSRCPRDVMCVWAGRLRLRTLVDGRPVVLTLGERVDVGISRFITLVAVTPDRWRTPPRGVDRVQRFTFRLGR